MVEEAEETDGFKIVVQSLREAEKRKHRANGVRVFVGG